MAAGASGRGISGAPPGAHPRSREEVVLRSRAQLINHLRGTVTSRLELAYPQVLYGMFPVQESRAAHTYRTNYGRP